jgi:hypothetical protein
MGRATVVATAWLLGMAAVLGLGARSASAADDQAPSKAPVVPPRQGSSETIRLFDGTDLEGWKGHQDLWSVQDGAIVGRNTAPIKVSTYLLTERTFSDFRLTAKVKLVRS